MSGRQVRWSTASVVSTSEYAFDPALCPTRLDCMLAYTVHSTIGIASMEGPNLGDRDKLPSFVGSHAKLGGPCTLLSLGGQCQRFFFFLSSFNFAKDTKKLVRTFSLFSVFCILYFVFCILYFVFCILYFVFCILYSVFCILYFVCLKVIRKVLTSKLADG